MTHFTGTASDVTSTVAQVSLAIKNVTDTKWWDGNDFTADSEVFLLATSTANWTFPITISSGKSYIVRSKARDSLGNVETPGAGNSFFAETQPPASVVLFPTHLYRRNALAVISGTATDETGLGRRGQHQAGDRATCGTGPSSPPSPSIGIRLG